MFRTNAYTILSGFVLLAGCSVEPADNAAAEAVPSPVAGATALDEAIAAMGMAELDTITYSGNAWRIRNSFRQTPSASPPWLLRDEITNYRRTLDLSDTANPTSLATGETFTATGGGIYTQSIPADQRAWAQQLEIWLTPWGFLKGAQVNGAQQGSGTIDGVSFTTLTWKSPASQVSPAGLQYTVTGYLSDQGLVERVETWVDDPFMGDLLVVSVYDEYRSIDGVMVPALMEQQRGGGGVFGVSVAEADMNPVNAAELLMPPASAAPPPPAAVPPTQTSEQLAEGVHLITTGYQALAVEFADYVAVFEAGQSESRGEQILAEVKRLFPAKPIRYLINSHPHSDHTAGMVPFVREGVTIITHENNVDFLNMGLSTPRTLLGQPTLTPQFEAAGAVKVLEDGTRRLELHHVPTDHNNGMLVVYLPNERLLMQADFALPQAGANPTSSAIRLAEYVDANGLDFDRYLAVHAAAVPQTKADLLATIGK